MTRTFSAARRHAERLDWLRAHPELLACLPGAVEDVDALQADALDVALRAMMLVRLYAPRSMPTNGRWSIRLLVSELRGQAVPEPDRRWAVHGEL